MKMTDSEKESPLNSAVHKSPVDAPLREGFPMDTYVLGRDLQFIEIDRLSVGSWVLSRCEVTGLQDFRRVTKKVERWAAAMDGPQVPLHQIGFTLADGQTSGIAVTAGHPFWVDGIGWVKASELVPGQVLEVADPLGIDDDRRDMKAKYLPWVLSGQRSMAKVQSVIQPFEVGFVYGIEVEEFHTYFVGVHGVWVHDMNPLVAQASSGA